MSPDASLIVLVPRMPLFVLAIALANFLVPLNSTMIVVALPAIARDLGVDEQSVAWLITLYLIAMAALQPIGGRIGDRLGPRRVLLVALVGFALASGLAPLARDLPTLIAFRVLQAVCACAITPNAMGLLRGGAAPGRVGTWFGVSGAMSAVGASGGPILGGILASADWRWIFAANVPLVLVILALGWATLPRTPGRAAAPPDVVGAIWLGATLTALAWTLTQAGSGGLTRTALLLAAVALSAVLFVRYESAHADAALPPALFRSRAFSGANACIALSNFALYGTMLVVPFALGAELALWSGVLIASMSVGNILIAPFAGALVDRFDPRLPVAVGGVLIAAGLLLPVAITFYPTVLLVALPVAGAGVALTFPATRIAALEGAPGRLAGLAAGVTSTSRYFGGIAGALLAGAAVGRGEFAAIPPAFVAFALAGAASALIGAATLRPAAGRRGDAGGSLVGPDG
jgi:EmrB/QacA subfamily drug resistance transporter